MATLNNITISGDLGSTTVSILIDSGASMSFITRVVAAQIATIKPLTQPLPFVLADGSGYTVTHFAQIALSVAGRNFSGRYLVQEQPGVAALILGEDHLRSQGLVLDYERNVLCPIQPPTPTPQPLSKETPMAMNEHYARVFGLLQWQINDALTDDDAVKMIVEAVKGRYMVVSEPILSALKLDKTAKEPEVLGTILALQHPGNVVPLAEHQAVQSELLTLKSAKLINDAIGVEGKISPAQKPWAEEILASHGYDVLAAALAKMPRTIPLGLKAPDAPTQQQTAALTGASAGEQLTALALQIQHADKLPFADALRAAQAQQPALAQQHLADMRGAN